MGLFDPKGGDTTTSTATKTMPGYVQQAQQGLLGSASNVLSPWIQPQNYTQAPVNSDTAASYDLTRNLASQAMSSQPGQPQFDANAYLTANPDVADFAKANGYNPTDFASYHYQTFGAGEGRAQPMTAATPATNPVPQIQTQKLGDIKAPELIDYRTSTDWKAPDKASTYTASTYDPTHYDASQVSGADITALLNPYTKDVVNSTQDVMRRSLDTSRAGSAASAAASGVQGGSRQAVADAIMDRDFQTNLASTTAQLMAQGYDKATATALSNAQMKQSAAAANAGADNTAGQFNAGAKNTAGQFNAGAQNTRDTFNASQGSTMLTGYNNNALDLYQKAMSARGADNATAISAAQAQDALKSSDWNRQVQAVSALNGIGQQAQAYQQQNIDTPLKYLQLLASMTPQDYGGTTTSTQPNTAKSPFMNILGIGTSLLGMGTGGGSAGGTLLGSLMGK